MNNDDLKLFILNYMENDKTGTALLLSAPWGFGKSYFIQEVLKPYLEHKKHGCIVVSLYGLNSTQEISKQIYLNLRSINVFGTKKSEFVSTGKVFGKTILNSALTIAGFDFSTMNESYLQEVFESIDLSGKLVVLEDLERSEIRIADILGYVNNLTENDRVKVLLVANEHELVEKSGSGETATYSDKAKIYLKFKEKTIGDTIGIGDDQTEAISNILNEYNLSTEFSAMEVSSQINRVNLRTFKYACQKSSEILGYLEDIKLPDNTYLKQFKNCIFYGVLNQSIALCKNYDQARNWTGGRFYKGAKNNDTVNGSQPTYQINLLFRFCFDYLILHEIPTEIIVKETYSAYCKYCLYEANQTANDRDLQIIKSYYLQSETDVINAISNLSLRLKKNDIPYKEYGNLARTLVEIKYDLDINIDECKTYIIQNLKGKSNKVDIDDIFIYDLGEPDSAENKEYFEFRNAMKSSLNIIDVDKPFGFDYSPEHLDVLFKKAKKHNHDESFISRLDVAKIESMILYSRAAELQDLRNVFLAAYRSGSDGVNNTYYPITNEDKFAIQQILTYINNNRFEKFDKIQKLQLGILVHNLTEMIGSIQDKPNFMEEYYKLRTKQQ